MKIAVSRERIGEPSDLVRAYVGDGNNNVANSLMHAAGKCNVSVRIASPAGYLPDPMKVEQIDAESTVTSDLAAVESADVLCADLLCADVWTSMGLEAETPEYVAVFPSCQVNGALLKRTGKASTRVMHGLPRHRGKEIADEVADGPASLPFAQAHNRLHAQKAILAHPLGGIPLE